MFLKVECTCVWGNLCLLLCLQGILMETFGNRWFHSCSEATKAFQAETGLEKRRGAHPEAGRPVECTCNSSGWKLMNPEIGWWCRKVEKGWHLRKI